MYVNVREENHSPQRHRGHRENTERRDDVSKGRRGEEKKRRREESERVLSLPPSFLCVFSVTSVPLR